MSESTPLPADVLACPADSFAVVAWAKLRYFAAYMAARYNGPVYLVGSSLRSGTPRDIDIRVVVADDEFDGRYGRDAAADMKRGTIAQSWIDDMAKRNGELARCDRINPDFQVYAAGNCIQYRDQPRVVLATPTKVDHLAKWTAWFDTPESA